MSLLVAAGFIAAAFAGSQAENCVPYQVEVISCLLDKDGRRPRPFDRCFYGKKIIGIAPVSEGRLYWKEIESDPVNLRETHVKAVYPPNEMARSLSDCRVKFGFLPDGRPDPCSGIHGFGGCRHQKGPPGTGYVEPGTVTDTTPATGRGTSFDDSGSAARSAPSRGGSAPASADSESSSQSSAPTASEPSVAAPAMIPASQPQGEGTVSGSEN